VITAPVEMLRDINIVDTPGTNAVFASTRTLTREFVPRSDLVLFVTSADRPFTESERAFLESIRDWGKKIVVVVNKIDILETEEDLAACWPSSPRTRARSSAPRPTCFPVAARLALRGKTVARRHRLGRQPLRGAGEATFRPPWTRRSASG
jgi:GTPase Era involved in 16S rRNA processing